MLLVHHRHDEHQYQYKVHVHDIYFEKRLIKKKKEINYFDLLK